MIDCYKNFQCLMMLGVAVKRTCRPLKMKNCSYAVALFLIGIFLTEAEAKRIPAFAGPYRALVSSIVNVSEDFPKSASKIYIKLRSTQVRGKQLQYGWGYALTAVPWTDDSKIYVTMASRSNNQWKKNAFVFKFDKGCSSALTHSPSTLRLMYGPGHNLTCPIKPGGLREIRNQSFELSFPYFPIMPYGRYLFTMAIIENGDVLGVSVADCEAFPRL